MIEPWKITGRLGNKMFEIAFLYSYARDNSFPLVDDALGYYYQDYTLFDSYKNSIRKLFGEGVHSVDKIAIHVRRGDYINNGFYVNLFETDYYKKAVALFPNEKFLIFCQDRQGESQDISDREWCQQ